MMYSWLHVEITNRCNAWCPSCTRNINGFGLQKNFILKDLDPKRLDQILLEHPSIHTIQLCGNDGDPCACKNFEQHIQTIEKYKNITTVQIHTNGSLRTEQWWSDLAQNNSDIDLQVWFGIDGLSDTHSYYRQGTNFDKIIANAHAFIKNGGHAIWQMLVFKHNQHQVKQCKMKALQLNFRDFVVKNPDINQLAKHFKTGQPLRLEPHDELKIVNEEKNHINVKDCMHLGIPSIYCSVEGDLFPCCMLARPDSKFPIDSESAKKFTIDEEFRTKKFRPKCLHNCGSKAS